MLAVDNMVIHKDAPRPDLALQFIDFMLDGKNSAELTNLIGSGNPNMAAAQYIKPELKALPAIFPPKDVQARLTQLVDLTAAQRACATGCGRRSRRASKARKVGSESTFRARLHSDGTDNKSRL